MIITIANAKGGVAKTTTAMFLGVAYTRRFPDRCARVLDADPQASASLWRDMIEATGETLNNIMVDPANMSTLQHVDRVASDVVIVDAPPQGRLLEMSVRVADMVIIPTSDSPLDLQQAWATLSSLPDPARGVVLLTRVERATRAYRETVHALDAQCTPRFSTSVVKRQEVKTSMGHAPSKLYEYGQVLQEIMEAVA